MGTKHVRNGSTGSVGASLQPDVAEGDFLYEAPGLDLLQSHPEFSITTYDGFVLCPICWEPTKHGPIFLDEVPDSGGFTHVIPIYHAECYRLRERNGKH